MLRPPSRPGDPCTLKLSLKLFARRLLDESLILEAAECEVDVETAGEITRGYSSVSSPQLPDHDLADPDLVKRPHNARVIKTADTARFGRMLRAALR